MDNGESGDAGEREAPGGNRDHGHHDNEDHAHGDHGHNNDQGWRGAVRYLRHAPEMWRSEINDAVVDLVDPQPGEQVVDIGAGMGAGTVVAARRGANVTAIEPTPFMRAVLTVRKWGQRSRRLIDVVDAGAEQLPVADGSADAMWATNSMHHWMNADQAVGEIARALTGGGRVVLVDENFDDPEHPDYERFGGGDDSLEHHGFHSVDVEAMAERLRNAGLVDVDTSRTEVAGRPVFAVTARSEA
ncbi:MAG: class I SAM-dependent methyltransferase [Acidimicrobiales bacterium]